MKLISLNTYGGYFFEPLMDFIRLHSKNTDIFCFQELLDTPDNIKHTTKFRANFFSEISRALPEHTGIFAPVQHGFTPGGDTKDNVDFGLGMFIKNKFNTQNIGDLFIVGNENSYTIGETQSLPFKMQHAQLLIENQLLTICNTHGTAWPINKLDSDERLEQSKKIIDFLNSQSGEKIITGDFNLFPETKSIKMFEESNFHNLIKDYNIKSTRGTLVKQLHPEYADTPAGFQEFADYTFVSSGIKPNNYFVPDLPISDHLPLILEFSIK